MHLLDEGEVADGGERGAVDAGGAVHVRAAVVVHLPGERAHRLGQHVGLVVVVKVAHGDARHHHAALQRALADGGPVNLERLEAGVRLQADDGLDARLVHQPVLAKPRETRDAKGRR
eukprot:9048368-Pyramimonas_sp.AAC.1